MSTHQNLSDDSLKKVCISTSFGDIKIKLYNGTPQHRDNFIKLAKEGYFNGTIFHRVIQNFMIQGGDPDSKNADSTAILGNGGPEYTIPAEIDASKYFHKKGALAAARTGDDVNPLKASSGSQFYIVQGKKFSDEELNFFEQRVGKPYTKEQREVYKTIGGTPHLDGNYTVFGEVYEGLDVVDKIAAVKVDPKFNRPKQDVKMTVKVIE
ncbi:MAG TPA: peptidylprolyl isomerase [Bacteroidales bacterium]|nr:peptidylprolyl isomerase [Bacteroidales bacterium]HPS15818.1 peptidylprolyl isomerase [Bacteroidales bacterium]